MREDLQLVIFSLDKEYYGIDTKKVAEISRLDTLAFIPRTAKYIAGVINLRGKITPVVCLRERLDLPPRIESNETRIVFVEIAEILVGLIVDAVLEVGELASALVTTPPEVMSSSHVTGVCHYRQHNPEQSARIMLDSFVQQEKNALSKRLVELETNIKAVANLPLLQFGSAQDITAMLYAERARLRAIENIALTDNTGMSELNTAKKTLNLTQRKYVQKSLAGAPAHEIVVSAVDGGIILAVSEPVRTMAGQVSGVILITTDLAKDPSLEFASFGKTGERYLVDRHGYFITKSRFLENAVLLKQKASAGALDLFVEKVSPAFFGKYVNYRGHEVYGAMNYIAGLDAVVVVEQEVEEMTGEVLVALLDLERLFTQELTGI